MDGLLIDSESISRVAWGKAAIEFGYSVDDQLFSEMLGVTLPDLRKLLADRLGLDFPFDKVRQRRIELGDQHIEEFGLQLKPGAIECLEYLQKKQLAYGLATSTFRDKAEAKLRLSNCPYNFQAIVCGDEVSAGKPAPEIFLKVASLLSTSPENCLILEDSVAGIQAGRAAKMHTVFVPDLSPASTRVEQLADKILNSLQEVPAYLEGLL